VRRACANTGMNTMRGNIVIKVTGIGGFFFRAKMEKWYSDNLGVAMPPKSYDDPVWLQEAGATVFQPFQHDTDYFGDDDKQSMTINNGC